MHSSFIFKSGKIVMSWNEWYCVYVFWTAPRVIKRTTRRVAVWLRWFAGFVGHNRGRHWDRKYND